jgi:hypothetical protein
MASKVGSDHVIGGVLHVQIQRDSTQTDPEKAFSAVINGPGFSHTFQIANNASEKIQLPVKIGALAGNLLVEVHNFTLLPANASADTATALSFLLVFKIVEIFKITVGSIPVSAALK